MSELLLKLLRKKYGSEETPAFRAACGKTSGILGIVCNAILCAAKLTIGVLSGALSVTADAVNNLSDAASSAVTMLGFRLSEKPADEDHPFGHARAEYLTGLIVCALILIIGYELAKSSFLKILRPSPVTFTLPMGIALALSVALKLWMALLYRSLGKAIDSPTLLAASADSRNDVISTAAVLLGCVITERTGLQLDGYLGFAVAIFILVSGVSIAKDMIDPLLGAAPDPALVRHIGEKLRRGEHVLGIHDLIVHDYGPGRRFASVHVEMDSRLDALYAHNLIDAMERDFAAENLQLVIHYDPVVTDDTVTNEARELVAALVAQLDPELNFHDFRMVTGPLGSNLIFDLVVPFRLEKQTEDLKKRLASAVRAVHPDYHTVINVDAASFNRS